MRVVFHIISTGGGAGGSRTTRYISERDKDPTREGPGARPLFNEDRSDLTYRKADRILDPINAEPQKDDLMHLSVSFQEEDYDQLGKDEEEKQSALRRVVCEGMSGMAEELNVEILFDDRLVLAAGVRSPWARRRKIDIAELINEPWILPAPGTWNYERVAEAFGSRGLTLPKLSLVTTSVHLRSILPADGPFITAHANSALLTNANRGALKVLPVELPLRPWPVAIVTLKNRTLSPMAERLIECARKVARPLWSSSGRWPWRPRFCIPASRARRPKRLTRPRSTSSSR